MSTVLCNIIYFCFKTVLGVQSPNQGFLGLGRAQTPGTQPLSEKYTCYFKPGLRPWVEYTKGETARARESRVPRKDSHVSLSSAPRQLYPGDYSAFCHMADISSLSPLLSSPNSPGSLLITS